MKIKNIRYVNPNCNPANLKFGVITRNSYKDIIFSPIYVTFVVNKEYNPIYIELIVKSQNFINKALKYQQGTVFERMAVAPADFLAIAICVPNKKSKNKDLDIKEKYNIIKRLFNKSSFYIKLNLLNFG